MVKTTSWLGFLISRTEWSAKSLWVEILKIGYQEIPNRCTKRSTGIVLIVARSWFSYFSRINLQNGPTVVFSITVAWIGIEFHASTVKHNDCCQRKEEREGIRERKRKTCFLGMIRPQVLRYMESWSKAAVGYPTRCKDIDDCTPHIYRESFESENFRRLFHFSLVVKVWKQIRTCSRRFWYQWTISSHPPDRCARRSSALHVESTDQDRIWIIAFDQRGLISEACIYAWHACYH